MRKQESVSEVKEPWQMTWEEFEIATSSSAKKDLFNRLYKEFNFDRGLQVVRKYGGELIKQQQDMRGGMDYVYEIKLPTAWGNDKVYAIWRTQPRESNQFESRKGWEFFQHPTTKAKVPLEYSFSHDYIVREALAEGRPVPPEVLKDYPELANKAKITKQAPIAQFQIDAAELKGLAAGGMD